MGKSEKTWERLKAVSDELRELDGPFQPKEEGEKRALEREKFRLLGDLAKQASEFLKARGFKSSGFKKGRKIPGLGSKW